MVCKVKEAIVGGKVVHEIRKGPELDGLPEELVDRVRDFLNSSDRTKIIGVEVSEPTPGHKDFTVYVDWHGSFKVFTYTAFPNGTRTRVEEFSIMITHVEALLKLSRHLTVMAKGN